MQELPETHDAALAAKAPMSTWQQIALSLYWFSTSAHWAAILTILLPMQAELIGGSAAKGTTLSNILYIGAFVSMVVAPFFGAWSDRLRTPWGRRKPFLLFGTLGNIIGLIVFAYLPARPHLIVPYIVAFCALQFFNNMATAPYNALIPDVVPVAQRGSASGWMGLMMMLGNAVGVLTGLLFKHIGGFTGTYWLLAGIMLLGMLGTVTLVREPTELPPAPPFSLPIFLRGLAEPFRAWDFRWVFFTRLLVMLGIFTVQEFLQFYFKDVIAGGADEFAYRFFGVTLARHAHEATTYFLAMLLIGAVVSSVAAGQLSDRYGRKLMVYLSGALQGIVAISFLLIHRFDVVVLLGFVYGLGYGAYMAVDWALVTDVLPNAEDSAKDMGLWHIAGTLPQVAAVLIAGRLLDGLQAYGATHGMPILGYIAIFTLAFTYFVLGTVLVAKIRKAR